MGEIQARKRLVSECEQAQAAFIKLTACFQQMATCLGSNTDGSLLRDELEETRGQAHKICTGRRAEPLYKSFEIRNTKWTEIPAYKHSAMLRLLH